MNKKKIEKIEQDQDRLKQMAEYYGKTYSEVYFVRDMLADCIIAVECAPAKDPAAVERANGKRDIFGYQDLFMTTRRRIDTNKFGHRMIGYESKSGNDTRLARVEEGEVPVVGAKAVLVGGAASISMSPFEKSMIESSVRLKQAASKKEADYEVGVSEDGRHFERFETFRVERMK